MPVFFVFILPFLLRVFLQFKRFDDFAWVFRHIRRHMFNARPFPPFPCPTLHSLSIGLVIHLVKLARRSMPAGSTLSPDAYLNVDVSCEQQRLLDPSPID